MPFIVVEGLDGAGKSTQLDLLKGHLSDNGAGYEFLHFPRFDAPVYGELIARFLRGQSGPVDGVDPYLVALIFAGDRAEAAPAIYRWLGEGKFVITDRYVFSNIAFQCAKLRGQDKQDALRDWILGLEYNTNKLPVPDISLFLDVPFSFTRSRLTAPRSGDDRAYLQGRSDIHEDSLDLQQRVREVYLRCAAEGRDLRVVDCSDGCGGMDKPEANFIKIVEAIRSCVPGMPPVK
ncbi:MAG: dTMP kinase [Alistipes sp.]|nr:dTMP kinase [Alistipes sp.]